MLVTSYHHVNVSKHQTSFNPEWTRAQIYQSLQKNTIISQSPHLKKNIFKYAALSPHRLPISAHKICGACMITAFPLQKSYISYSSHFPTVKMNMHICCYLTLAFTILHLIIAHSDTVFVACRVYCFVVYYSICFALLLYVMC